MATTTHPDGGRVRDKVETRGKAKGPAKTKDREKGKGRDKVRGEAIPRPHRPPMLSLAIATETPFTATIRTNTRPETARPDWPRKTTAACRRDRPRSFGAMGQPLPGSVVFYPLPGGLLGDYYTPAPAGYQYVRVASDILMMAIGTRMIVGALADLSAM